MQNYTGQRLSFQGDRCTVRYTGKVEGKDGSWLGVEWDDDQKGKHDGIVGGHRYFYCQSPSLTAASLIRPSRKSDTPVSFLEALEQKYASVESATDAIRISGKTVEEVGFEKIQMHLRNYQKLETVILNNRCITIDQHSKASQANEIRNLQLKIRDLDLGQNLIQTWDDVFTICASLEHLRSLNVSGNRFSGTALSLTTEPNSQTTWQIKTLGLSDTLLSWEQIVAIVSDIPELRSLTAWSNNISHILQPLWHSGIRSLDLSFNRIASFKDLTPLSELPHLELLLLRANPLTDLSPETNTSFDSLQHLDLTGTGLPGLNSLNSIPKTFPFLKYFQTKDTPLSKVDSATLNTIARVPNLIELNHTVISAEDRQNAELFYYGTILKELEMASDEAEETRIMENHPMWNLLCKMHGTPTIQKAASNAVDTNTLGARLTIFTFYISIAARNKARRDHKRDGELSKRGDVITECGDQGDDFKDDLLGPTESPRNTDPEFRISAEDRSAGETEPSPIPVPPDSILEKSASIPRTISCYALQGIVGRLFSLPPPFTTTIRLFYKTNEWDPVAGTDGEDDGWSVSEDDDDDDDEKEEEGEDRERRRWTKKEKGKMVMRTEELVASTKPVGDWVTEKEARVKVVLV